MLLFGLILLILLILFVTIWQPSPSGLSCQTNLDCPINYTCDRNVCLPLTCSSNQNCEVGICIPPYCYANRCSIGNDCPNNNSCINGICIPPGNICTTNTDCQTFSCLNGQCVQCQVNSDCPVGQGCFEHSCRYPYSGETGTNLIFYPSKAQENGNISAPPGYFCSRTTCGTGPNGINPISCSSSSDCNSTCPYCIDSVCRCTAGKLYESCTNNSDCLSGKCSITYLGTVCVPPGDECSFNFQPLGCNGCCPTSSHPYCVDGICSDSSQGAPCGYTGAPSNLCSNPTALIGTGTTGISPDGMGFFCVNGTCQDTPASLNEQCTTGSCEQLEIGAFVCAPEMTPTILQHRCRKL